MTPVKIDLSEYVHSGEGANGESFFHRSNPLIMLKLYNTSAPSELTLREFETSKKAFEAGLPVPEPGDLVTDGERTGIRFARIPGKISFARAIGNEPERVEEFASRFGKLCLKLHSMHLDRSKFQSVRATYLDLLEKSPFFTPAQKEKLAAFIEAAPDSDAPCHGDLQFGNAVMAGDGTEYFIDLGDLGYAHPCFDLGMVMITGLYNDEEFTRTAFHMNNATAALFWEYFVKAYFGSDIPRAEVEEMLKPYAGLKTLIIERDTKRCFPEFHALLDDIMR